jgi:Xaa-Pro aminopeptidase
MNSFDMGTSKAIYSALYQTSVVSRASPIVQMRSQKNEVEREGMRHAHVKDAVASCESFRILEEKV